MKLLFEYLTSSFSLLDNPIDNYVVMAFIGMIAYGIAFGEVGKLYRSGFINGRGVGHVLHWIIRFIVFVGMFYISATIIRVYNWFSSLPDYRWWICGFIISLLIIGGCLIKYFCSRTR